MFSTCWLTTNRACNLRCKWCYAQETGYKVSEEMSLTSAQKALDLCHEAKIKKVILIGGEPTIYSQIFSVLDYCNEKKFNTALVTNGIAFSDRDFLQRFIDHNVETFSLSMKAENSKKYKALTGLDGYNKFIQGIENLTEAKANFSVGIVLSEDNIDCFVEGVKAARDAGARKFSFSFCYNFDMNDGSSVEYLKHNNPYTLAKKFSSIYPVLSKELKNCKFILSQSLPYCTWNQEDIEHIKNNYNAVFACQLLRGKGLLFDTDLSLIPCNAMYKLKYGKYGIDFNDYTSLCEYLKTEKIVKMFRHLRGVPDNKCLKCAHVNYCSGGCALNWTNYSFQDLERLKRES